MIKLSAILAIILILAIPVTAADVTKVEIRGVVFDEKSSTYNTTLEWDAQNFTGFWYTSGSGKTSEILKIEQAALNLTGSSRTIEVEKLLYNTSRTDQKYKVFSQVSKNVVNGLDYNSTTKTFTKTSSGSFYARLGWFGEVYVAVNGKANKLARIVKDQPSEDKKTLASGKTWELGEGVNLTANAIDAKASPRQAHLILSRDGTNLDDKIVTEGQVYTYVQNKLAGESDVPVFVTYVESIFSGATGDIVQLRYTWLISQNVIEIKAGDKFGVFEAKEANENYVLLYNKDKSIRLDSNTVQPLYGDLKFKVADDSKALRFYPFVEQTIPDAKVEVQNVNPALTTVPALTNVSATTTPVTTPESGVRSSSLNSAVPSGTSPSDPAQAETPAKTQGNTATPVQWNLVLYAVAGFIAIGYIVLRR